MAQLLFSVSLEDRILTQYQEVMALRRRTVEQSWHLGKALTELKDSMFHGNWLPWLDEHQVSRDIAHQCMRLFEKYDIREVTEFASVHAALKACRTQRDERALLPPPSLPDVVRRLEYRVSALSEKAGQWPRMNERGRENWWRDYEQLGKQVVDTARRRRGTGDAATSPEQ